ncbi:MAG: hypothetical protein ACOC2C_02885 [Cyclonatronaceae bacterium]
MSWPLPGCAQQTDLYEDSATSAAAPAILYDSGTWTSTERTGVAIASRFNHYSNGQYEKLRSRAEAELLSSYLTSVYVAWFGTGDRAIREFSEFAIPDERPLQYQAIDSTYVGSTLIYRVAETPPTDADTTVQQDRLTSPQERSFSCGPAQFAGRDVVETASCWHARARLPYSEYDAHPAFVKAKQQALAELGQYLGIRVQQLERQGEELQSITHQYAAYAFGNTSVSRLVIEEEHLSVYISVPKDAITKL